MQRARNNPSNWTRQRILATLQQHDGLNKHELAKLVFAAPGNVRRYLSCLQQEGLAHICGWCKIGPQYTAVWAYGPGEGVPKPAALTAKEHCRRWRSNEQNAALQAEKKRVRRMLSKVRQAPSITAVMLGV